MARVNTQFKMFRLSPVMLLILFPLVLAVLALFALFMLGSAVVSPFVSRPRVGSRRKEGAETIGAAPTVEPGRNRPREAAANSPVIEAEFRHVN